MENSHQLVLSILFIFGSVGTTVILYNDLDHPVFFGFIIGYLIYIFLLCGFMVLMIVKNMKKLKGPQVRKKFIIFISLFIPLSIGHFLLIHFIQDSSSDIWDLGIPFGVSVGLTFSDLMFASKKDD
ncbi:hypothetical protein [Bacillus sp. KH172YL63]|uniref:hypothetical protein n=1 Tax=Bacillus sp. KH172YL63 TaxID=2709784 RepID=UPI0013E4E6C3|nr:hypothetical protein [Bacillus sp. KH172YL63]BCB03973.1 hypothetical protein KH172YL63_21060 [Bacillus sp. KH172YL63]